VLSLDRAGQAGYFTAGDTAGHDPGDVADHHTDDDDVADHHTDDDPDHHTDDDDVADHHTDHHADDDPADADEHVLNEQHRIPRHARRVRGPHRLSRCERPAKTPKQWAGPSSVRSLRSRSRSGAVTTGRSG